ncbi:MAG: NFACT family protein [Candidatus Aenigmarchaeota archaeon]|nr:NFACT family protein [Candidatus Aenigmarchaeota archaeon]
MLTPLDFHYLVKELRILERCKLKRIYKSENIVFEFKPKKGIFSLVAGKNFCYLDPEKPKEKETKGFINFLSERLKGKTLIKIEQDKFNKILVLDFSDYQVILEFIGRGNIILCQEGKIAGCLFQREFKDRKIRVGEKYIEIESENIENYLETKDEELLKKIHIGKIYTEEILKNKNLKELLNKKISPRIYFKDDVTFVAKQRCTVQRTSEYFVSPFELDTLKNLRSEKKESFSLAIKEVFSEERKTKTELIRENQKKTLEKYKREIVKFKEQADLFFEHKSEVENAIKIYKENKKIITPIKDVLEKKGVVIIELEGNKIELNINIDLKEETNKLYKKSKKAREKIRRIELLIEKPIELKESKFSKKQNIKLQWYEHFRYFHTSDNFLVVAGKDTDTNEKLVKKYCKKNDIILHAHIIGSPFGIIRNEGKKITEQAIKEAAQFVGCYSRFWISKLGIADVYWVTPDQVSKTGKGHVKKGSFMIYGKKNFLRNELIIYIGINDNFEIVKGPFESIKKHAKYFVGLIPGGKEGKELGELIKLKIFEKAKKEDVEKIKQINLDEFLKVVPYGKGEILKK